MRMMIPRNFLAGAFLITLVGCATTSNTGENIDSNSKAAEINTQLGAAYLSQGELELADEKLRRALKQNQSSATTHWVFALLQERLGENEVAEKHFRKAVSLNPKDSKAHNNYGTFLCNQKRYREAEKEFLYAIENPLYAQTGSAYANAGLCVSKIPDLVKAEEYFQQSLRINPSQRTALYQMAILSFGREEYAQTANYIQRYEKVAKHNSESLWVAFQSSANLGYEAKANSYAEQLKKLFPSSKEARLLAESYWYAGKSKQ